jgi:hypothetical protein
MKKEMKIKLAFLYYEIMCKCLHPIAREVELKQNQSFRACQHP